MNNDEKEESAPKMEGVDSLHPKRDSEPNSAASSAATSRRSSGVSAAGEDGGGGAGGGDAAGSLTASRRSTAADIESDESEGGHFRLDQEGRRKSKSLREAVQHLKEEAIRR